MCCLCDFSTSSSSFGGYGLSLDLREDAARLVDDEAFAHHLVSLSKRLIELNQGLPRLAGLFAAQQRWLLSHAALAHHFWAINTGKTKLTRRVLANLALKNTLSSRNTAYAFFDEVVAYDVINPIESVSDREAVEYVPAPASCWMLCAWYSAHLNALDAIYGGNRASWFMDDPHSILRLLQPELAYMLLSIPEVREPGPLYTIFTWADAGGLLMDRLVAGIEPSAIGKRDCLQTNLVSISFLAKATGLSRAHTSRKLSTAAQIGGIGWLGPKGHSSIWISHGFYKEYAQMQALKLLILDHACSRVRSLLSDSSNGAGQLPQYGPNGERSDS